MPLARTLVIDREKMADEPMHRPMRGHGQPQPHSQSGVESNRARRGEDPLAELARLIGQEDPFAEFSGSSAQRRASANGVNARPRIAAVQPERRPERQPAPSNGAYARERQADHGQTRQPAQRQPQPVRGHDDRGADHAAYREQERAPARMARTTPQPRSAGAAYDDDYDQPAARPRTNGRADGQYAAPSARPRDPYADEAPRQSRSAYAEEPRPARRADRYQPEELPRHARTGRQQAPAYQEPYNRGHEDDYDPDYADDAYLPEHADDIYGEVPRPRRSWGLYLVIAIVAACVVAVAFLGVFAYRTIFNSPTRPAVVTKSNAPTKVDPKNAPQNAAAPNKAIQDRIGATGPEQVLTREEQPADLTQQPAQQRAPQNAPAFAPPPQQQAPQQAVRPPAFAPTPAQQQTPPQQAVSPDQPKKVKTMTVRSDGTVVPNNQPLPLNANPNSLEPETPVPGPVRPRSDLNQNQSPQANRPQQQAAVAPSIAPATSGNYIVQVASHKSQEEAQTAWTNLRTQHGTIFQGRNADIRRVDLGDRGVFYRAMVGPMGRDQANALCQNLKTAGAGCIVQTRN